MRHVLRRIAMILCVSGFAMLDGACNRIAPQDEVALPMRDTMAYANDVQPLLEAKCATLDCHGAHGRPLRLYAVSGLRISDDLREQPGDIPLDLTEDEVNANVLSIAAIDPDVTDPDQAIFLLKPLGRDGGGVHHEGGTLWPSHDDVAYVCVRAWWSGTTAPDACMAAAMRDALPPTH